MTALANLPSLAVFAEVVEHRSFTAAARATGIAKSAVSKRVAALESRLGVRLLNRSTRRLSLTDEGVRFYEHCAAMLRAAKAAEEALVGAGREAAGVLRITAPVTFSQMYLVHALAAFARQHPRVAIHLSTDDRIVDVVEGGFDVAIRIGRLRDTSLFAKRLATDRLVVVASPDYLKRAGIPEHPEDLVHHQCLHYQMVPRAAEWRFRGRTGALDVPTQGGFETTDGTVLRHGARAGLGLAVLPFFMVAKDVAVGRLQVVLEGARRAEIGVFAVYAHRAYLPMRTRAVLEHMSRWFATPPWTTRDQGKQRGLRSRLRVPE
jgi:DNA-binding transcriptional LysR family regulator